jgi:hypothetical protein
MCRKYFWLFILKIDNNFIIKNIFRQEMIIYFDFENELSSVIKMEINQQSILRSIF